MKTTADDQIFQEESKVAYTPYSELPHIDNPLLAIDTIKSSINDPHWKTHFNTINLLRSLNKHTPDIIAKELPSTTPFLIQSIQNLRSNISKNALLLVQELGSQNLEVLVSLMPSLFQRTLSDMKFIADEAKASLLNIVRLHFPQIALAILPYIDSKAGELSEYAGFLLSIMFDDAKFTESEFALFTKVWWKLYDGTHLKSKRIIEKTLINLADKIGKEKFTLLLASIQEIKVKGLMELCLWKTKPANPKMNMKDFKKMMLAKEGK